MKHYYLKNVINQIVRKKVETCIIFSIVLVMSLFLSLTHFFGYNDSMETNIANTLSLRYEINNNHAFGPRSNDIYQYDYRMEYLNKFVEWIEEVEQLEDVAYSDYNIQTALDHDYDKLTGAIKSYRVFGVSSENYLMDNHIELVEGRFFSQDEIDAGMNYIVVSDKSTKQVNGEEEAIKVGDQISLGLLNKEYEIAHPIMFEVVGIYKVKEQSAYYEQNDSFVNSKAILIPNQVLFNKLLLDQELMNVTLNHICFYLNDYKDYVGFHDELNQMIQKFNQEIDRLDYISPNLSIYETNTGSIIQSVQRIKNVYQIVFILVFVIVTFILVSSIYYLLKRKVAEMSVYYSLGQTKSKIILHYILTYMMIGFVAIIIGMGIGYLLSNQLSVMMLRDNVELQSELLKFTSTTIDYSNMNDNIQSLSFDGLSVLKVMIEIFGSIFVSVTGSMLILLKDNILSRNGGWN